MFEGINESAVAARFADLVREYVGPEAFAEIRAWNKHNTKPPLCASHDYCDANVFLFDALREASPEFAARWDSAYEDSNKTDSEVDAESAAVMDELSPVWNRIHAIATTQHFTGE